MSEPHLLNLPPPPSDTPSDFGPYADQGPPFLFQRSKKTDPASGTPNSGISQLSTVAIKEGERGKARPYAHTHTQSSASDSSTNTLDAERADRISRLAGLERVAALRGASQASMHGGHSMQQLQPGYFDNVSNMHRSTVGSASATGSVGGSVPDSADKMSEDADEAISSNGMSDDGDASLVGFGETASSTVSGPTSTSTSNRVPGSIGGPMTQQSRQRSDPSGSPIDMTDNHVSRVDDMNVEPSKGQM